MSNSPLVNYTKISPNKNVGRNHVIDTVTIHCTAGHISIESLGNWFSKRSTEASSNYGIGDDGRIGMYVQESDRSWCSSSPSNDNRAVTIEVSSDSGHPYACTDAAYRSLIRLLVDICKRNGIAELKWRGDKSLIGRVDKQNMTVHMWFRPDKTCPGEYLLKRHTQIAAEVNTILKGGTYTKPTNTTAHGGKTIDSVANEVIAGKWGTGEERKNLLTAAGYDYSTVQARVNQLLGGGSKSARTTTKSIDAIAHEVIAGKWGTGDDRKNRLRSAGYDYATIQNRVNQLLGSGSKASTTSNKKSIDAIAREVIVGKWGNGDDRKNRLRAAGYDYNAVQKRVNQLI